MSMTKGVHRPHCLTNRVRQFFKDNPHEELSYQDMVVKFECNMATARTVARTLREEGLIESMMVIRRKPGAAGATGAS